MFSIPNHTPEVDYGTIQGKDNKMVERCRLISTQEVLTLPSRWKLSQEYARIEEIAETLEFEVKKCTYLQGCKRAQGCVELIIVYANEANEAKGPGHRPLKHTTYQLRAAIGLNFRKWKARALVVHTEFAIITCTHTKIQSIGEAYA
ncbi:hypothetical protein BTUL_0215g00020 [Botrytis tulipae]|uniref:Uncharacterized protein n=1 Tax=Botrytis tulipae TaxID=87230 RepID=A0A4Z1EAU1_9HELO|nr:hypothetical protein BTUL_0215g00020 [Botrytis tulipae]